jgi:beta-glucosidase-like glycosyl hydrolase/CubicO group peptidase (beta-lactamase class C family)
MKRLAATALALAAAASCLRPAPPLARTVKAPPVSSWAKDTLATLSVREKAAQMIGVRANSLRGSSATAERRRLLGLVKTLGVGCVVVFDAEVDSLPRVLNDLQREARLPMLVAADMERGVAFRIRRGVAPLPYAMAAAATGSLESARLMGEVAAREGRALGIHWAFAPVADVNSNPRNPVINIRSFGDDPQQVAAASAAFVEGASRHGLLTTAKHFPGHGDTAVDTHLQLATIGGDRRRLSAVELLPFRRAVAAGVDAVMIGHIAAPSLDPSGTPATLSQAMVNDVLRGELGFSGLIVTDAMEMGGLRTARAGDAAVQAVRAGADLVLLPPEPEAVVSALVRAVSDGQLTESRLDESVLRILNAKERLGLHRERQVDAAAASDEVGRPEDVARAQQLARESVTVVRNRGGVLPLRPERPLRLLHLVLSSDLRNDQIQAIPEEELRARRIPARTIALAPGVSEQTALSVLAQAPQFSHVLVSAFVRVTSSKGSVDMAPEHARLIERLSAAGHPVIVVSFGSPYLLRQFPDVPAYVCAYGSAESSQRAAVAALFGEFPVTGRLPVTIPGLAARGEGLMLAKHEMTLRSARPEEVGFKPGGMLEVDRVVDGFLEQKAFPGAVLAVGKDGALVHLKAYGRQTYDKDATPVTTETLYDLASLTKVIVTTTMAMSLVDAGRLDLAKPVSAFLPRFSGGDKDKVTVWHLLTHSGGVDWWAPLYKDAKGKDAYLEKIYAMDLKFAPGAKSVYSDLGILLLGEILERVAGESIDQFARERIFRRLGMKDTGYRPPKELLARVAPTEFDKEWRGRLVHGEVHDENAAGLGGIAPHAGLFGSAGDLARFAQMLLNGGVYDQQRLVSRATVERFVAKAGVPDSSRALGWDTTSQGSSAGTLMSARAFGHTGFTGTSMWMDPERQLFVILLTNRVHPTRENNLIRQARPAVADAVMRALAGQ